MPVARGHGLEEVDDHLDVGDLFAHVAGDAQQVRLGREGSRAAFCTRMEALVVARTWRSLMWTTLSCSGQAGWHRNAFAPEYRPIRLAEHGVHRQRSQHEEPDEREKDQSDEIIATPTLGPS